MKEKLCESVEKLMPQLIRDIKTVCNIDSRKSEPSENAPFGQGCVDCLNKALELAKDLGFKVENVGNQIGIASYGESDSYIACVGHLDVVDINGTWKTDPFTCTEIDGTLYARGVLDNKGPIFSCLYALKALVDSNYDFPMQVQIIFGTDEESGMDDMKWYFKDHPYPLMGFTPDCKFPVVYAERGRAVFKVSVNTEYTDEFYAWMNQYILNHTDLALSLGVDYSDEEFGKNQVRKVELFNEANAMGITLVCSYPASYTLDTLTNDLKKHLCEHANLTLESNIAPVYFAKDTTLVKCLEAAYEEIMNEDGSAVTTTGGTYAKVVKNIVPFGPSFKGQKGIGHMPNEWMNISDIEKCTKIYALGLYKLLESTKG